MENKIIHQTWSTSDLPALLKQFSDTWKSNHVDWEYRLWTNDEMEAFLIEEHPLIFDLLKDSYPEIKKWDIARLAIVYKFGGLYCDIDSVAFKNISPLIDNEVVLFKEHPSCEDDIICNSMFYSNKQSRFLKNVLGSVKDFVKIKESDANKEVVNSTGPMLLTNCYSKYKPLFGNKISIKDHTYFERENKFDRKQNLISGTINKQNDYGVHFGFGSWIVNNMKFKYCDQVKDNNVIIN